MSGVAKKLCAFRVRVEREWAIWREKKKMERKASECMEMGGKQREWTWTVKNIMELFSQNPSNSPLLPFYPAEMKRERKMTFVPFPILYIIFARHNPHRGGGGGQLTGME